jgi:hypothetical protein
MAVTQLAMSRQLTVASVLLTSRFEPGQGRSAPGFLGFDRRGAHLPPQAEAHSLS